MRKRSFFVVSFIRESLQFIYHVKIDVIFVIIDIKVDVSLVKEMRADYIQVPNMQGVFKMANM